jgi:hypothetical protein
MRPSGGVGIRLPSHSLENPEGLLMSRQLRRETSEPAEVRPLSILGAFGLPANIRSAMALGQRREAHPRLPRNTRDHVRPRILRRKKLPFDHRRLSILASHS